MSWAEVLLALLVSHLAGDFLAQTDWQARMKAGGLSAGPARRALAAHMAGYAACFVPALVWPGAAALVAVLIVVPHAIQDDRRLLVAYARRVKRTDLDAEPVLAILVDQAAHAVTLFAVALLAAAL